MIHVAHIRKSFIHVVVGQFEIISYTKCTKSAVIQHKTLKISQ